MTNEQYIRLLVLQLVHRSYREVWQEPAALLREVDKLATWVKDGSGAADASADRRRRG